MTIGLPPANRARASADPRRAKDSAPVDLKPTKFRSSHAEGVCMPALKNQKYERFAQERAFGKNKIDAWEIAVGKRSPDDSWKLDKRPEVKARIEELKAGHRALYEKAVAEAARPEITAERIVNELAKIAFADLAEDETPTAEGTPRLDLSRLSTGQRTPAQIPTAGEPKPKNESDGPAGRQESKRLALMALGRHLGLFDNKTTKPSKPPVEQLPLKDRILSKEEWDAKVLNRGKK
jgi:hypothetical protein